MFGHDDSQQQQTDAPTPDGALTDQTQGAPAVTTDDNTQQQEYVMPDTVQPAAPSNNDMGGDDSATDATPTPSAAPAATPSTGVSPELLQLKQQALQELRPLVGHLDQSPEEKFRTLMMMIQASDNDTFIKDAYDAAQAIPDEKTKAQALLDVVNEINYFTHAHQD